jgi:hypothetical protein
MNVDFKYPEKCDIEARSHAGWYAMRLRRDESRLRQNQFRLVLNSCVFLCLLLRAYMLTCVCLPLLHGRCVVHVVSLDVCLFRPRAVVAGASAVEFVVAYKLLACALHDQRLVGRMRMLTEEEWLAHR